MRYALLIMISMMSFSGIFGQEFDYEKAWKDIEKFQKERKPDSALKLLEEILNKASEEGNDVQKLKGIFYKASFIQQNNDYGSTDHISYLDAAIIQLNSPNKQIAYLMAFEVLYQYYTSVSYQAKDRTYVENRTTQDVNLWASRNFEEGLLRYLEGAMNKPDDLIVPIDEYKVILNKYTDSGKELRPILYDVVWYNILNKLALPLLSASDVKPMEIGDDFFAPYGDFVKLEIIEKSSTARQFKIYQDLLRMHMNREEDAALIHTDLNRLAFAKNMASESRKDALYLQALEQAKNYYKDASQDFKIDLKKAEYLLTTAYQEDKRSRKKEAYEIFKSIPESSSGYLQAQNQIQRILQKSYQTSAKEVFTSREKIKFDVKSTNLDEVDYKLVRLPFEFFYNNRKSRNELQKYLKYLPAITSGKLTINENQDFLEVNSTFSLKNPGYGYYALLLLKDDGLNYTLFTVSNLAVNSLQHSGLKFTVMDRITGAPIHKAEIHLYENVYNRKTRNNDRISVTTLCTDKEGKAAYGVKRRNGVSALIEKEGDTLYLSNSFYINDYPRQESNVFGEIYILSDRSIYRPGQTLYFKGVLIKYQDAKPSLGKGSEISVQLRDANGSIVKEMDLKPNDFGSVASNITLPSTGLTGMFTLEMNGKGYSGSHRFRVEEYRRPKFEVTLENPKNSFRLSDTVTVEGKAESYTGIPITDAEVAYRIYRQEKRWWWYARGEKVLIKEGRTMTNEQGGYTLKYAAEGEEDRTYLFTIEAVVTDLSGETRTGELGLTISKNPFFITMDDLEILDVADATDSLGYYIKNSAGEEITQASSYQITKLKDPGYLLESDYFENLYGSNRGKISAILKQWKEEKIIQSYVINGMDRKISLQDLTYGGYKIQIRAGRDTLTQYIAVTDKDEGKFPFVQPLFVYTDKGIYSQNESVKVLLGSPYDKLYVQITEDHRYKEFNDKWIIVKGKKELSFNVSDKDYGGFVVHASGVIDNNKFYHNEQIQVPWDHKKLSIEYISMRDVLDPGSNEKWTIKIKGPDQDAVLAEVCASMYDMSLDQFTNHSWGRSFYSTYGGRKNYQWWGFNDTQGRHVNYNWNRIDYRKLPSLVFPDLFFSSGRLRGDMTESKKESIYMLNEAVPQADGANIVLRGASTISTASEMDESVQDTNAEAIDEGSKKVIPSLRKNLQETVFFYPELQTDNEGNIEINFTTGEALTSWKLQLFAHDQELRYVFDQKEIVTRKELMVFPYPPRFLRQGDRLVFSGKISNNSELPLSPMVSLQLLNARTEEDITNDLLEDDPIKTINLPVGGSAAISYRIVIPDDFTDPITYRMVAENDHFTDGEQGILPVVSNQVMVTNTRAFAIRGGNKFTYSLSELMGNGEPLSMSFDYTAHPVWTVIQAIPSLADYPHDCSEQLFNKYFAYALGEKILTSIPSMDGIMKQWSSKGSDALLSNLQKNEDLKSAILENTPWVKDAADEESRKRALSAFFMTNQMDYKQDQTLTKILGNQNPDGGFPWFKGGYSNVYITQYFLESMGRMKEIGLLDIQKEKVRYAISRAMEYVDESMKDRYDRLEKLSREGKLKLEDDNIQSLDLHYLFSRSYYDTPVQDKDQKAYEYYHGQAQKYWVARTDFGRALIARYFHRRKAAEDVVQSIIESFEERVLVNPELGAYWKYAHGYYWYQSPIETHTQVLELFQEVKPDHALIFDMQLWLLNHKRTNTWSTTKSTSAAIYALLKSKEGTLYTWTSDTSSPDILMDGKEINDKGEIGTGYVKKVYTGDKLNAIKQLDIVNHNNSIAWGGIYFSYMEPVSEVKQNGDASIDVKKSLFKKTIIDGKEILISVEETKVVVGDEIVSRIEITTDRDMSFMHLKDMRASGLEPIKVLSGYRWKGGIGYYESTRDMATHFFIDELHRGTYVFEYILRVSHKGDFENGLTTLQSMYAPEFSSHSASSAIRVEE